VIGTIFFGPEAAAIPWPVVLALGFLAALLSLDDTALAQTWLSQPLPAGIVTGAFCGDPLTGLAVGLPCQLIMIGNIPVGRSFTGEIVCAIVATVGGLILSGHQFNQPVFGGITTQAGLLGWAMVGFVSLSWIGQWIIKTERKAHLVWMLAGHRSLRDGNTNRIEYLHARCFFAVGLRGFTLGILWVILMTEVWLPMFSLLPARLVSAS